MKKVIIKQTDKFNLMTISYRFIADLNKESVTSRSLLPFILRSGCKKYRNEVMINKKLHDLYGSTLSSGVVRQGSSSVITFTIRFIDPKIINDEFYNIKVIDDFMKEIIYNPCLIKGGFRKKTVLREKETLADEILSQIENKASYAIANTYQHLLSSIRVEGYLDDLDDINELTLVDTYNNMINNDNLVIAVCGNLTKEDKLIFDFDQDDFKYNPYTKNRSSNELINITDYDELHQSQLCLIYENNIYRDSDDYEVMLVLNTMLGSSSSSLLFTNIREKHSLCYSIRSNYNAMSSTLLIYMGIKQTDKEQCIKLVDEQIDILINSDYDDEFLDNIKDVLYNQYLGIEDSGNTMLSILINKELFDIDFDLDNLFKKIKDVNKESISRCAKLLKKSIIYFLTKRSENE